MGIAGKLKNNAFLRRRINRHQNHAEFFSDARRFNKYYIEESEKKGDFRYRILWLVHNLEKGMSAENPRPFAEQKVKRLAKMVKDYPENRRGEFEFRLACAALKAWKSFFESHGWADRIEPETAQFISSLQDFGITVGCAEVEKIDCENLSFEQGLLSRRSVRDFEPEPLNSEDIDFALKCFVKAPSACNRQMCRVYGVKSDEAKELLKNTLLGLSGFNADATSFFLITYDISAFEYYGERNQGFLNAGLAAMNFVNGLHSRGIGSCFVQWSNKRKETEHIKKALGIPDNEVIAVAIGAGYYKKRYTVLNSERKSGKEIYKEI